jgi:TolB-like protein/Tfp pilus assembly protein PilF
VLPLANLSGDPSQDYFADGMTDELITELAKIRSLRVISRTSVMRYQGTKTPLPQIAKELRVDAVVEGSVVRSGDKLRITAQLIEANTDKHLWAESYERNFNDVLTLQREVASAITGQVNATLTSAESSRLAGKVAVNSQAHEDYLRGLFFWNKWTEDGVRKSITYFQQAIQADPNYAPAYAGLANSNIVMGDFGVGVLPPHEANAAAEQAALKAISLDETLAEAHAALAMSRFRSDGDLSGVEAEFKRAIELSPGSATAHHWYSHYLLAVGQTQNAVVEGERAYDLSPVDPEMGTHMQFLYLFLHRYDDVIEQGRKNLELDPNFGETYFMNGQAFEQEHMDEEAGRDFSKAVNLSGHRSMVLASFGHFLAVSGDRRGAQKVLAELNALSEHRYVPAYEKGLVHVGLGDNEAALRDLKQAYKEGSHWIFILQTDARLDPLRPDPQFQQLVRRVRLPQ